VSPEVPLERRYASAEEPPASVALIDELEAAVAGKDLHRQSQVMRRLTDLFLDRSSPTKPGEIALFDDVMSRLVGAVDARVRADFGARLVAAPCAPERTLRRLALDDSIDVAGPVLEQAEGLPEAALIETAQTKSQGHLLAISRRRSVPVAVTDVLVDRGDEAVLRSTAGNAGARFSTSGVADLSARAASDPELACRLWSRADVPREQLLRLVESASRDVMARLVATNGAKAAMFRDLVAGAASRVRDTVRDSSERYATALAEVEQLNRSGQLDESHLKRFAEQDSFDEVLVALSLKCDLPVALLERALVDRRVDQLLVCAKAAELSWETTRAILAMLKFGEISVQREVFGRLQATTARTALQYYRLRSRVPRAESRA
jgi:uncharacterized protein (DUF2336 family)